MSKTDKKFLVDILRRPFVHKEDAEALYEIIHDEVLNQLLEGNEVNLFGLASIKPVFKKGHKRNSFEGEIEVPDRMVLKSRVYPRLKNEWKEYNDD
jgi:nucleoid DNA-binding protein